MALFGRRKKDEAPPEVGDGTDFAELLMQGRDAIEQTAQIHQSWGLADADRWDVDQTTGTITFTFPDRVATAPVQIIGSYSKGAGTFMWAWANPSILPEVRTVAEQTRDFGRQHGFVALTTDTLTVGEEQAVDLVALAFRIGECSGFYRNASAPTVSYFAFGPTVTISRAGEQPEEFTLQVGE